MQIAYRICKQMVFQTEFPDRFSTSGKLCTVHIVDQENSSGGQAFIEQRKCGCSWSIDCLLYTSDAADEL